MTSDESRCAGWYHSLMIFGPEPKPIQTGCTFHLLCVNRGPLKTFKMWVHAYSGKTNEDLNCIRQNTDTMQKWINLYSIMLEPFKGAGRMVTIDSEYMGDIMALVGHYKWKINMVGTANENRTGADAKEENNSMKKCTCETNFFQHDTEPLCYAMWSDNNIVRTLPNFHSPIILENGLWRKRKVDNVRERSLTPVSFPEQNQY